MTRAALARATDFGVAAAGLAGLLVLAGYAATSGEAIGRVLLASAVPLVGFGAVAVFGTYLARATSLEHTRFVAGVGVLAAAAALAVTATFVALLEFSHGVMGTGLGFYVLYATASVGLAGGVVVGHLYAKQRRRTRQLRAANAELREQNERLDAFASIISHDLRNPLAVASGYLELALETESGRDLDDVTRDHLAEVAACHDRIETLVDQVLALARMERDPDAVDAVDVAGVATDALGTVPLGDGELVVETTAVVETERGDLRQVFENLYRNAIEHAGPNPTIHVQDLDDQAGFAVSDDGPGIPPRDRDAVFDRGYSDGDGTGLGLAIVREVAETYDWDVAVTDGHAGGARFEFRAPEAANDVPRDAGTSASTRLTTSTVDARADAESGADAESVGDAASEGDAESERDAALERAESERDAALERAESEGDAASSEDMAAAGDATPDEETGDDEREHPSIPGTP